MSENDRLAIGFSNGIGNFILMTAALKILRQRFTSPVDMITDSKCLRRNSSIKALAERFFDGLIVDDYDTNNYKKIYYGDWSCPICMIDRGDAKPRKIQWKDIKSPYSGTHEVQIYLDMIGASYKDFSGFLIDVADEPDISHIEGPRVCFANASSINGSRRGSKVSWSKFRKLAGMLSELDYSIITLGLKDEIDPCGDLDFTDQLDIFQTAKVISQCDLMICTDTGLMHVADALRVPIILLMGPTPVTKSRPLLSEYRIVRNINYPCAPCFHHSLWNLCKSPGCMNDIKPDNVLKALYSFNKVGVATKNINRKNNEIRLARLGGRGDILNVMPILHNYKRLGYSVKFYTAYPEIVRNQPFIDEVIKIDDIEEATRAGATNLRYKASDSRRPVSIVKSIAERHGVLDNLDLYLPIIFDDDEKRFIEKLRSKKFICISNEHSNWSPAKGVKDSVFLDILEYLRTKSIDVYFLGTNKNGLTLPSWVNDLRGGTSIRTAMCYVAAAYGIIVLPGFYACVARHTQTPSILLHTGHAHPGSFQVPWSFHVEPQVNCKRLYCASKECPRKNETECQPTSKDAIKILDTIFFRDVNVGYALACYKREEITKQTLISFSNSRPQQGDLLIYNDNVSRDTYLQEFLKSYKVNDVNVSFEKAIIRSTVSDPNVNPWVTVANHRLRWLVKNNKYDYLVLIDNDCEFRPIWIQKAIAVYELAKINQQIGVFTTFDVVPVYKNFETVESENVYKTQFGDYRIKEGVGGINYIIPTNLMDVHKFFSPSAPGSGGDSSKAKEMLKAGYHAMSLVPSMIQHIGHWQSELKESRVGDISQSY